MNYPEEKDVRIIEDNEITLSDLVSVLLKKKLFIISLSLISTFVGISFSFFVPDTYKSTALLTPAQQSSGGISSQFSSIASFAGISLPSEGGNKTIEALERIKSYDFFSQILSKELRIEDLMAVDSWDPETNTILYDPDLDISLFKNYKDALQTYFQINYLKHVKNKNDLNNLNYLFIIDELYKPNLEIWSDIDFINYLNRLNIKLIIFNVEKVFKSIFRGNLKTQKN